MRPPGRAWLFPVRFNDVDLPSFDLGAGRTLNSLQRTDLFGSSREAGLARLAVSVAQLVASPSEPWGPPVAELPSTTSKIDLQDSGTSAEGGDQSVEKVLVTPPSEPLGSPVYVPQSAASEIDLQDSGTPEEEVHQSPETVSRLMKALLRNPAKDIELHDYVLDMADRVLRDCLDKTRFPTSGLNLSTATSAARLVIDRVGQYWEILQPLAVAMATGAAWGIDSQDQLWSRAMRAVANTTPMEGGQTVLLDLRAYPRVVVMYAAALGAVAQSNYSVLRAITIDAKYRDQDRLVPVINVTNTAIPFATAPYLASVVAQDGSGPPISDEQIENIYHGRGGVRFTPVSDDLHNRLREIIKPVMRDNEAYDDTFDRLEVLFGVIAEDAAIQEKASGGYLTGGWVGRYAWRSRHAARGAFGEIMEECRSEGPLWKPVRAGLFGASPERAIKAFKAMTERVEYARQRM
jgi:hypothetical protein